MSHNSNTNYATHEPRQEFILNEKRTKTEKRAEVENEFRRSITFELLFRVPLWYVYYDNTNGCVSWYWISALKAIEVGEQRKNGKTEQEFKAFNREHCEHIQTAADLGKLFTHRLPSAGKIGLV